MVSESQLRANFFDMLERLVVPETPSASIRARVDALPVDRVERYRLKPWVPAAAAAFIVAFSLPVVAPGFTLSIEERIARILQWSPPPVPVSPSLRPMLRGRVLDLAAAKRAVDFRIVVPAGLPAGSVSTVIRVASKGIYSAKTHRWVAASKYVEFEYARRDGGTFDLIAAPGSSLAAAPSRYMLEERGTDKKGNPMVVRRERFVWRNGSQVMTAIVGDHLSAAEILAIRDAMHGFPVATVWPPKPSHGAALLLHP